MLTFPSNRLNLFSRELSYANGLMLNKLEKYNFYTVNQIIANIYFNRDSRKHRDS